MSIPKISTLCGTPIVKKIPDTLVRIDHYQMIPLPLGRRAKSSLIKQSNDLVYEKSEFGPELGASRYESE